MPVPYSRPTACVPQAPVSRCFSTLSDQAGPISHSQLLKILPTGQLDEATVYRNLSRLSDDSPDSPMRGSCAS